MRVYDVVNAHSGLFGRVQVGSHVTERINDSPDRLAAASEHVGRRHRVSV
jgi:hypothetical protein